MKILIQAFLLVTVFFPRLVSAEEVRIAVATNFLSTLKELGHNFENETDHVLVISSGSTGKLYAQIRHGAPFEVFLSADASRPQLLEEEGMAVPGSRFTYAVGKLTLWSPDPKLLHEDGQAVLARGSFKRLAIANPKTAPYGAAAKHALESLGLWPRLKGRIVQGENIGQTLQFVVSRNAQLGFVALSQIIGPPLKGTGSRWDVPEHLYEPILQQAVLLVRGQSKRGATAFLEFLKSPAAQNMIKRAGYGLK